MTIIKVIKEDLCIGCGVCAIADPNVTIVFDDLGRYQAQISDKPLSEEKLQELSSVCPFSGIGPNEDEIAKELFKENCSYDNRVGYYLNCYAGYVAEGEFRLKGSSGGMVSWLGCELLNKKLITGLIHVVYNENLSTKHPIFKMSISLTSDQITGNTQSRYYPVTMSEVLKELMTADGVFAIVGVPCFIKAIRLLSLTNTAIRDKIRYTIGILCGHFKSAYFTDYLVWRSGYNKDRYLKLDYRRKAPDIPPNRYLIRIYPQDGSAPINPDKYVFEGAWSLGLFQYNACNFCDDVFAETADIAIGDAWLDKYRSDWQGTNLIITRTKEMDVLLKRAWNDSRIHLEPLIVEEAALSQKGSLYTRRKGLSFRLWLADKQGKWYPRKRVSPSDKTLTRREKRHQLLRMTIVKRSHILFQEAMKHNNLKLFTGPIYQLGKRLYRAAKPPILLRILNRIKRLF